MPSAIDVRSIRSVPNRPAVLGVLVASDRIPATGWDRRSLKKLGFEASTGQVATLINDAGSLEVLVGVGPSADVDVNGLRSAAATFAGAVSKHRSVVLVATEVLLDGALEAITEGLILGAYRFDRHKSAAAGALLERVNLVGTGERSDADAVQRGAIVATAQCWARDLVNEPGGSLTARAFADQAAERAESLGLQVEVMGPAEIEAARLGGLMAVNQGSGEEPRFVKLSYVPADARASLALVGKGITFDSGGLSIKPAEGMMTMKSDMGGAAAAIAAVCAIAELGLPGVAVTTYAPMTDNMTGGFAIRPGDVFVARNGKTVEVLNTDAEGRLILADVLVLASEDNPDMIVDLATLTGACLVALGDKIAGLLSPDDRAAELVGAAAVAAGERFWRLPLPEDYRKMIDSDVADLKNIGSRLGGTLTAGLFLKEFVAEGLPWVHLDIAGPAWTDSPGAEISKGGTGFAVRTLVELARAMGADTAPDAATATADP